MGRPRRTTTEKEKGKALGAALQKARGRTTTEEVANKAGIPIDTLRRLEQGRVADPGFFLVCSVARAVRIELRSLEAIRRRRR